MGPEPPAGARGGLQAWDPVNQKLKWNIEGGGGIGGGTTTTAGNLVFQVINDGRFRALSADKGEVLYEVKIARTGMAPPITYEVDGTQYIAFGGGLGRAATIVGPNDAKVENAPMLFVFALGGKAQLPEKPPTADTPAAPPAGPAPEQQSGEPCQARLADLPRSALRCRKRLNDVGADVADLVWRKRGLE
jgi:quinohemoprotein ethanol dehydrogenase